MNWTCPHCNRDTTITETNYCSSTSTLNITNSVGFFCLEVMWIVCPNTECGKFTLTTKLFSGDYDYVGRLLPVGEVIKIWSLIPTSFAKLFPDYVPQVIREDYEEACSIVDLSPKASATLARRALQGMIRDFWGISKSRLVDEINAIKDKVDPITWKAIEAIRKVGNIGAHMEKDINLIIEVDKDEAKLLIQLIELLVKEWYIHKFEREQQLQAVIAMSKSKEETKGS